MIFGNIFFSTWVLVVNFVLPFFKKSVLIIRIEKWEIKHKTYAADIARGEVNLFKCHRASFCHWATKYLSKQITNSVQ